MTLSLFVSVQIICRRFRGDVPFSRFSMFSGIADEINAEMNTIGNPTTSDGKTVQFEEWRVGRVNFANGDIEDPDNVIVDIT